MDDFVITISVSSLAVTFFCAYGILPLLKTFLFCAVILLLLHMLLLTDSALPSDLLFQYTNPNESNDTSHKTKEETHDHDDQITKKLRQLSTHLVQDFILSWYRTVSDDVTFVQNAFEVFEHIFVHCRKKISDVDRENLLNLLIVEFTEHVISYKNAVEKVDSKCVNRMEKEWRDHHITIAFTEDSPVHPVMQEFPISEVKYLRGIALLLLKEVLPENYSVSDTPLYLVRELIMQNVLFSLVEMICDPLFVMEFLQDVLSDEISEGSPTDDARAPLDESHDSDLSIVASCGDSERTPLSTVAAAESTPSSSARTDTQYLQTVPRRSCEETDCNDSTRPDSSDTTSVPSPSVEIADSSASREDIPLPLLSTELHFAPEWNPEYSESSEKRQKLFHRIRIVDAIIMREAYDTNKKYVLYKITYNTKEEQSSAGDGNGKRSLQARKVAIANKKHQVQRRFREFLALQERLSQNLLAKTLLSNIKGPSRMFPVPFGNMDGDYIEQRRKFLQAYLREISSIPHVSNTKELREFLAYESDPRIAYVKKPEPLPRLDKLFKSAIQDLLGSTTMKFTNINSQGASAIPLESSPKDKKGTSSSNQSLSTMEIENVGAVAKLRNKVFGTLKNSEDDTVKANTSRQFLQEEGFKSSWRQPEGIDPLSKQGCGIKADGQLATRGYGDGCDSIDNSKENCGAEPYALSAELILKLVFHGWSLNGGQICCSALLLKRYIRSYMVAQITKLTSDESWTKYLTLLTDTLWPEGKWRTSNGTRMNWSSLSQEKKEETTASVEQCLKDALPDGLRYLVGDDAFNLGVSRLVSSLQDSRLNRRLFYKLLDMLLTEVLHPSSLSDHRPDVTLNFASDMPP